MFGCIALLSFTLSFTNSESLYNETYILITQIISRMTMYYIKMLSKLHNF